MEQASNRELNKEFQDNGQRNYAYEFDYCMHEYMMRSFDPFSSGGSALEIGCFKGGFTQCLAKIYDDLTVVEGSSDLVTVARGKFKKK